MSIRKWSLIVLTSTIWVAFTACGSGGSPQETKSPPPETPKSDYTKPVELINASTDGTDALYQDLNAGFIQFWREKTKQTVTIRQSAGDSSKQQQDIIRGNLKADLVELGVGTDIDAIQTGGLIGEGWQQRYDYNSSPFYTVVAFMVRSGNPKGIREWEDLIKPGVQIVAANPKTYSDARWSYAGAWAYAYSQNSSEEEAKQYVSSLFKNAAQLDADDAASRAKFTDQGIGDVWITTEREALQLDDSSAKGKIEVVIPSTTLSVEPVVSVVDRNADAKLAREAADGYADYLFTEPAQTIAARHYYRPRFASVAEQFVGRFKETTLLTVDDTLSGWEDLNAKLFADGGLFDQLTGVH